MSIRKIVCAVSVVIVAALLFSACFGFDGMIEQLRNGKTTSEESEAGDTPISMDTLWSFAYSYGSFNGGEWEFEIVNQGGEGGDDFLPAYFFTARGYNGVDMNVEAYIEQSDVDGIMEILRADDILSWDGFDERDDAILDGYGFNLTADFSGGKLAANGYEKYPENYQQGHAALSAYLNTLADSIAPLDIEDVGSVHEISVRFYDSAGLLYSMNASREKTDDDLYDNYASFMTEQYNEFKNETDGGEEYCVLYISSYEVTNRSQNEAVISKAQYPDVYAEVLERSLLIDGKPVDYLTSEEYQTEVYKSGFIYPAAYLYDDDGLGEVVVDLPEQTITVNGVAYTASREDMLKFYDFVDAIPHGLTFAPDIWRHELTGGYLEDGQTAQGMLEGFISDGNTWIIGRNHIREAFYLYGGKEDKPDGWNEVVAAFEMLIEKAHME